MEVRLQCCRGSVVLQIAEGESKMSSDIFFEAFIGVIQMKVRSWFTKFERKSNGNNTH